MIHGLGPVEYKCRSYWTRLLAAQSPTFILVLLVQLYLLLQQLSYFCLAINKLFVASVRVENFITVRICCDFYDHRSYDSMQCPQLARFSCARQSCSMFCVHCWFGHSPVIIIVLPLGHLALSAFIIISLVVFFETKVLRTPKARSHNFSMKDLGLYSIPESVQDIQNMHSAHPNPTPNSTPREVPSH